MGKNASLQFIHYKKGETKNLWFLGLKSKKNSAERYEVKTTF